MSTFRNGHEERRRKRYAQRICWKLAGAREKRCDCERTHHDWKRRCAHRAPDEAAARARSTEAAPMRGASRQTLTRQPRAQRRQLCIPNYRPPRAAQACSQSSRSDPLSQTRRAVVRRTHHHLLLTRMLAQHRSTPRAPAGTACTRRRRTLDRAPRGGPPPQRPRARAPYRANVCRGRGYREAARAPEARPRATPSASTPDATPDAAPAPPSAATAQSIYCVTRGSEPPGTVTP